MAAKVISVVNNKGGVGKTTSTAFFGEILALFGKRVLLVDTDESGNLSLLFNHFQEDSADIMSGLTMAPQKNVSEIFMKESREGFTKPKNADKMELIKQAKNRRSRY